MLLEVKYNPFIQLKNIMKINSFKIRDRLLHKNKLDPLLVQNQDYQRKENQDNHLSSDYKFEMLMDKFQQFINIHLNRNMENNPKQTKKLIKHNLESDYRDRYVLIDLPSFKNGKVQLQQLEVWIGQLSQQILSVTFNFYSTGKFTYEQSKVYASESFLRNICRLVDKYDIKKQELKFMDKKMKQQIFPYLKTKYPMTNEKDSNKSLQKAIKQINNIEVLTNDFFYYTNIQFQFRENGRYDDLIMRLLNEIMGIVNQKSKNTKDQIQMTNFKDFQNFMAGIFQKTYDESWMNNKNVQEQKLQEQKVANPGQNENQIKRESLLLNQVVKKQIQAQIKNEAERQKYKLQVQQYTNFQIGRKISENTQPFSEDEIQRKYLIIKSSAVLRILTKWCDQLWQKFDNENYFIDRTQGIRMQKGNQINIVYHFLKVMLKKQMKDQKLNIVKFMKDIEDINYSQQMLLLKSQLRNVSPLHIDKLQRVTGKFSCKVVNNLQNFTIIYLNRLIHGLTTVSKNCFASLYRKPSWTSPPNLISFKIGDLMRCKFSSKQREVLKVFQQIQRINDEEPQKMKIVRIKNRLKLGTNDVLLNVRFNNKITCQIQLAISSTKTQFINCSYNFSHYVYELQRSFFGPISQFCSIWKNLQSRSKQFSKLIQKQVSKKQTETIENTICHKLNQSHILVQNDMPFVCCECGKAYYQNNYMINHVKCTKCVYWKCAVCQIIQNKNSKNKRFFLDDDNLNLNCSFLQKEDEIPQYGVCIFIKKKPLQAIVFKQINYRQKYYLFKKNQQQNKAELMRQIGTLKQVKNFFRECVVFSLQNVGKQYIEIDINQAKQQFLIPSYIEKCFKLQKETISILGEQLSKVKLDVIQKTSKQKKKCIKYIQFSSTSLTNMKFVSKDFVNLDCLNLNLNKISKIKDISKFPKLQKLYITSNLIQQIPLEINILTKLKQINLSENKIGYFPPNFVLLKSLVWLNIEHNYLSSLPQNFYLLQNLKYFIANRNQFKYFPDSLSKHKQLEHIKLAQNLMYKIPEQIEELGQLRQLILQNNKLIQLPKNMLKMKKLQNFNLSFNCFEQFNKSIYDLTGLVKLNLSKNKIKNISFEPQIQNLKNLTSLQLSGNQIQQLNHSFKHLKNIEILRLSNNNIIKLSQQCFDWQQLREIELFGNKIEQISANTFKKCKKLSIITLQNNCIKKLPNQFQNLKKLKSFSITNNQFNQFPLFFTTLANLKIVDLSKFKIQHLPQNIGNMKKMQELYLPQNLIQNIPDSLGDLQFLRILNLNQNKIQQLNLCIFKLTNLQQLCLNKNSITIVPDKFQCLKKLKRLYICQNKIQEIPESIQNHERLQDFKYSPNPIEIISCKLLRLSKQSQINLQGNQIKLLKGTDLRQKYKITTCKFKKNKFQFIPQILFLCPNVADIDLAENLVKQLPKQISLWKNIKSLNLQNNLIEEVPQQIGTLENLSILNLKCQTFKILPKSMQNINLKCIFLLGNKLQSIQNLQYVHADLVDFSNQNLTQISQRLGDLHVKEINFRNNKLSKLPESICKIVQLTELSVVSQKLKQLPQNIGNLINLTRLNFLQNFIQQIPKSIGNLKNLKRLNMNKNKIKQIPLEFFNLQSLQQLDMVQNKIKIIPKQIQKLKNLMFNKLNLSQNPIQEILAHDFILQKGEYKTIHIAKCLKDKQKQQLQLKKNEFAQIKQKQ